MTGTNWGRRKMLKVSGKYVKGEWLVATIGGHEYRWHLPSTITDSVVESVCLECGATVETEPDASTAYCWECGAVRPIFNPVWEVM